MKETQDLKSELPQWFEILTYKTYTYLLQLIGQNCVAVLGRVLGLIEGCENLSRPYFRLENLSSNFLSIQSTSYVKDAITYN